MKKSVFVAVLAMLCMPFVAAAQSTLNAFQTVEINAPASKVWDLAKVWNNLHGWHPVFSNAELTGGKNNEVGATRRLTIKDGPSFDEELLAFDDAKMMLNYRIIGENPLPLTNYNSTMRVSALGANRTLVVWRGSFASKPEQKDDENIKLITGVYRAGLDNLKKLSEGK